MNLASRKKLPKMRFLIFLAFLLTSTISNATSLYGGQITYKYIGSNTYEFELIQFYDSQAPSATQLSLQYTSANCGSGSISLSRVSLTQNANSCGPYLSSIATYKGTKVFQSSCTSISLTYSNCCKGFNISNLTSSGNLSTQLELDIVDSIGQNSSPKFNGTPIIQISRNQTAYFNFTATDADGDSLAYQFASVPNATYAPTFSPALPFGNLPISLNQFTGALNATAPSSGSYLFVVEVLEYRNGVLLGRTKREVLVAINQNPSNNSNPTLSGVNSTSQFSSSVCAGDTLSFYTVVSDLDLDNVNTSLNNPSFGALMSRSNDTLFLEWPVDSTFTRSQPYSFVIRLDDGNCGILNQVFSVKVNSCLATSIKENKLENFSVYPNPATEFIQILTKNLSNQGSLRIYDLQGKLIDSFDLETNRYEYNLDSFKSGIYFFHVLTPNHSLLKKVMVK